MGDSSFSSRLAGLARSNEGSLPAARGLMLYGAAGLVLLALIGIFFSERFTPFIGWLPVALVLLAIPLLLQPVGSPRSLVWLGRLLAAGLVLGYLALGLLNAYVNARFYDGSQYDGAFQLFFPLRRMDHGEWPGRDFFYFHGQWIPLLVYPLYKLFGADFFAAQFAAKLIDLVMPLAYFLVFRWLGLDRIKALLATVVLVGLLVTDRFTFGTQNPVDGIHIYALRSLIPVLYLAYLSRNMAVEGYGRRFRRSFYLRQAPLQAALFVVSFYLGTEQAFYLLAAMLLANLLLTGIRPLRVVLQSLWLIVLAVGLLLLANLVLFGSQQPLSYLGEISKNQTWFYGSYPNEFLHSALDFSRYRSSAYKVSAKLIVCLLGVPALIWLSWLVTRHANRALFYFAVIGGAYGLIGLTSLAASYAGEQYTDNAIKVLLIGLIVLLTKVSFRRHPVAASGWLSRVWGDLNAAAPLVLLLGVLACMYSTLSALKVRNNLRLLSVLDTPAFMSHPDLGVKLPYYPLDFERDDRYHASQFLALAYANGNEAARVIYPEMAYLNGFQGGVKKLFQLRVGTTNLPEELATGDVCAVGDQELAITDIDRQSGYLSFSELPAQPGGQDERFIDCYRKPLQDYVALHGRRIRLEQNLYDRYFQDGVYRGSRLQLRLKGDARHRLRVGDFLQLGSREYRIAEVHPNDVVVLDGADHPLPFAFDGGSSFEVTYRVAPDNTINARLPVVGSGRTITRVLLNDQQVLAEMAAQPQVFLARTNQAADVVGVDLARATLDLRGSLDPEEVSYGLHLGQHRRAAFNVIHEIPPVFQLMRGILSAKQSVQPLKGSSIDFYFHTFSTRLLDEYLDGLRQADPRFVSTPSGRYVNNFNWYDNWLVRARWPVFEHLLASYDPVAWSRFETFWRKGAQYGLGDGSWSELPIVSAGTGQELSLPSVGSRQAGELCTPVAYEVELDYRIEGWQRSLPLLGGSTRHLAYVDDQLGVPLTFNPNEQTVRFPVLPLDGETRIRIGKVSPWGVGTTFELSGARFRRLDLPAERIGALIGRSATSRCL